MTNASVSIHDAKIAASAPRSPTLGSLASRTLLLVLVAMAVAISLPSAGSEAAAKAGSDLTHLLRFMAMLKAVLAVAALAAVFWRLGAPVTRSQFAAYAISSGVMAAGPGLIWGMDHVAFGAVLLHGGLLASVLLLWRDPATLTRLGNVIAYKRRRPG